MIEPKISGLDIFLVEVSPRGNWIFIQLRAGGSLTGIGEASHGCGFSRASAAGDTRMRLEIERFYAFIEAQSPFAVEAFRNRAWKQACDRGLPAVTAFSGLEQAMCDLAGKASGLPVYQMLGGKKRDAIPVYANINRAVKRRTPEEFAENAEKAAQEGFRAVKAAPFDDFPSLDADAGEIEAALERGMARVEAMRKALGGDRGLMVDCHGKFSRDLGIRVAALLAGAGLDWYEEPVPAEALEDTLAIRRSISQRLAGGEILFGREGFEPLCKRRAVDVIMPDVKHCGGIFEAKKIALLAESHGIEVSPHNPSGPVSMAASAQLAASLNNFVVLEHAWGEVNWRSHLIDPAEQFENGALRLTDEPGLGCRLSPSDMEKHLARRRC